MKTKQNPRFALANMKSKALDHPKCDSRKSALAISSLAAMTVALSADAAGTEFGMGGGGAQTHQLVAEGAPVGRFVAATIETPPGWQLNGGVNWQETNDGSDPFKVGFTTFSGDGAMRVQVLPSHTWTGPAQGPAPSAQAVLHEMFLPSLRPGARVLEVKPDMEATRELQAQLRATPHMQGARSQGEAVVAVIEYQEGGTMFRERIGSALMVMQIDVDPQMQAMAMQMGMPSGASRFHYSQITAARAPVAAFEPLFEISDRVVDSFKFTDQWNGFLAQYKQGQHMQNMQRNQERIQQSQVAHQSNMAAQQALFESGQRAHRARTQAFDIQNQTWRDNSARQEAGHRNWLNGHLGRSDFTNPHTGTVETHSDSGGRMWQDNSGNTFETQTWQDDPRMAPENWNRGIEELQRIQW